MNTKNGTKRLEDKTAIVTGGGCGIGRAIVFDFAREGARVLAGDIDESCLQDVKQKAGREGLTVLTMKADITREDQVYQLVELGMEELGRIDILVNNAGVSGPEGIITDISKKEWDRVLNTNLTGMYLCSKTVVGHMIDRGAGNIINLSSGAGLRGAPVRRLPYVVSKFGVEGLTYGLAQQLKGYGICVNAMRPAPTATNMATHISAEMKARLRKPEEISKLAVFLALQTVETMTGESIAFAEWEKNRLNLPDQSF
ncbi:MAG: SDR family oxidoreductase [Deltaproteobacteria bacterium]|nr:SDR family oxidoreductase [Deltaproteobacteria bacterium]MBW2063808.1 SDR family oxidoreductase [Deltaproteobacteria bacterium]